MKINKIEYLAIHAKIMDNQKPEGFFKRIAYKFSEYNNPNIKEEINGLSLKLVREELAEDNSKKCYVVPKEYEKLFKLYGAKECGVQDSNLRKH